MRDPDDQVLAGVCAAFGRYTDTDPVLWRVVVAVLAVFGGAGVALYLLGWVLIPRVGEPESWAERTLRRPDRSLSVGGIVLLVVVAVLLLGLVDEGAGLGVFAVIAGLAYLVARERRQSPPPAPVYGPVQWAEPGEAPPAVAPAPRVRREPSPLGGITASLALIVTGVLFALRENGVDGLTTPRILAVTLLVLGAGLLVGTWWGRAPWLLPVGLVVALLLAGSAAAGRSGLDGGLGERSWRAVDGGSYSLGAGEATLDLRGLRGVDAASVEASVGFGQLIVLVPQGMSVGIESSVGLGEVTSDDAAGLPRERRDRDFGGREEDFVVGDPDDVTVELDLEVGMGEIEVRRVSR